MAAQSRDEPDPYSSPASTTRDTPFDAAKRTPVVLDVSAKAAADPDSHTRECALKCQASGYGIITKDHKYLKFDSPGNAKIAEALKASDKKDHLRVDVTGDVKGDTLQVSSIKLL